MFEFPTVPSAKSCVWRTNLKEVTNLLLPQLILEKLLN